MTLFYSFFYILLWLIFSVVCSLLNFVFLKIVTTNNFVFGRLEKCYEPNWKVRLFVKVLVCINSIFLNKWSICVQTLTWYVQASMDRTLYARVRNNNFCTRNCLLDLVCCDFEWYEIKVLLLHDCNFQAQEAMIIFVLKIEYTIWLVSQLSEVTKVKKNNIIQNQTRSFRLSTTPYRTSTLQCA